MIVDDFGYMYVKSQKQMDRLKFNLINYLFIKIIMENYVYMYTYILSKILKLNKLKKYNQ